MIAIPRWTLIVVLAFTLASTLCAQPPGNRPATNSPSGNDATQRASSQPGRASSESGGGRSPNATTGRDDLTVERGSIPQMFSQDRGQNNSANGRGKNQQSTGRGNQTSGGQKAFIQNALRFDSNADRKLAANELANLFHVLASSQQLPTSITQPRQTTTSTTSTTTSVQADANFIQRDSVRQALVLFLQLALQFDANGDGLLSQPELYNLATSLLANDMGLLNAAARQSGQQSRTTTTTTQSSIQSTGRSANQNIRLGTTVFPPRTGQRTGKAHPKNSSGDDSRPSGRPDRNKNPNTETSNGPPAADSEQNAQQAARSDATTLLA